MSGHNVKLHTIIEILKSYNKLIAKYPMNEFMRDELVEQLADQIKIQLNERSDKKKRLIK